MNDLESLSAAFERLKARIKIDANGCWIWQGALVKDMYGSIKLSGNRVVSTHRLAYMAVNGPIPRGKVVRHMCDVTQCCNPAHLVIGDHEDNTQDMVDRGRHKSRRVLTTEEQAQAVQMRRDGFTKRQIAEALKCNWYAVSAVLDSTGVDGLKRAGRPKGSRNANTRITDDAKRQMKELYATGQFTQQQLAQQFGCDQTYVSLIVRGLK